MSKRSIRAPKVSIKAVARIAIAEDKKARAAVVADKKKTLKAALRGYKETTADSFQNFEAKLGIGTDNVSTQGTYGFNPITRQRTLLEWMYRGSWLAGIAVDIKADDMTRAGVELKGQLDPDQREAIEECATTLGIWDKLNEAIKWGRLYGGAIAVMLIDGQNPATPLRIETVGPNQFKGLLVLDRWMLDPSMGDLVTTLGPDFGMPRFYRINASAPAMPRLTVHHSRCIRINGIKLPYWQRVQENMWGMSILERLYDRMLAYDSASQGAAQLVYKAFLRTMSVEGLRDLVSGGGKMLEGLLKQMAFMGRYQSNEGVTLIDGADKMEYGGATGFTGLSDVLAQFGQQISGALQIPLVRLFGQSPGGMGSSGESEIRTYYDAINQEQKRDLLVPVTAIYRMLGQSLGIDLEEGFSLTFKSLWQLTETEKADYGQKVTTTVTDAEGAGLISKQTAMKELRQSSHVTGIFTNITDEDIEAADDVPDEPPDILEGANGVDGDPSLQPAEGSPANPAAGAPKNAKGNDSDWVQRVTPLARLYGLHVVIENPKGSIRNGIGEDGKPWSAKLGADYGYLRGAEGADGDQVDCFVGPDPEGAEFVYIIDQRDTVTKAFDEHKVMLGFPDRDSALAAYKASYSDGQHETRIGAVSVMPMPQFLAWVEAGKFKQPFSGWFNRKAADVRI